MINYETILSNYDDKLTLMQWLKKVEAALENASATAFHVNKRGNATLTFSIDFADGTSIESEPIVLQQGESVASARISNGQLILTLTNGDELNAGNILNGNLNVNGNVSVSNSIETEFLNVRDTATLESAEVTGSVDVGGGLYVGGEITGGSIIEDMGSDYSFVKQTTPKGTLNYLYAGIVKNGNKVTIVNTFEFTPSQGANDAVTTGRFMMPTDVMSKIVPSSGSLVDVKTAPAIVNAYSIPIEVPSYVTKYDNRSVYTNIGLVQNLVVGTTYLFRQEVTFLLSDNMAS